MCGPASSVVEAMAAIVLADFYLINKTYINTKKR
jgi:chorismate synthase